MHGKPRGLFDTACVRARERVRIWYLRPVFRLRDIHQVPMRFFAVTGRLIGRPVRCGGSECLMARVAQYMAWVSKISSAFLCQTNDVGSSFHLSIHSLMDASISLVEQCVPRRSHLVVSSANQRSSCRWVWKCRANRGCRSSQRWTSGSGASRSCPRRRGRRGLRGRTDQ